jgi:glutamine synthetase type III
MSIINQNKMKVDNKGGIIIEVYGSMLGSTIIISTESEIDVKVQTSIASAISLAEQVTSRVVSGLKVERHLIYKGEGVTDVWGKIISGATERFGITAITDTVYWIAIAIVIAVFAYFAIGF